MEMKHCNTAENRTAHRTLLIGCASALAATLTVALPQPAHADHVTVPDLPANIRVDAGNTPFLIGHATGTQNYICLPCPNPITPNGPCPDSGFAFTLFTPEATLFKDNDNQIITHFFSPNPAEGGTIRATWQHSHDTSTVWAFVKKGDAAPAKDAVDLLKLTVVGAEDGPIGPGTLTPTTFIQRVNTVGGVAPAGCDSLENVGTRAFVPYTADYIFYKADPGNAGGGK
jgi:hypothetical protein